MTRALISAVLVCSALVCSPACVKPPIEPLQLEGNRLTVTNTTSGEWRNVEVWLNTYYRVTASSLAAHGRLDATLDMFVSGYAQHFDVHQAQVRSLRLKANRPDGTPIDIDKKFEESGLAGMLGGKQ